MKSHINIKMAAEIKNKPEVSSLYILKAIFALVVVAIHTPPLEHVINSSLMSPIAVAAVPVFFAITGYFLYTDRREDLVPRTKKMLFKSIKIWIITNIVYFLYHTAMGKILYSSWSDVGSFFILGMTNEGILWYLYALVNTLIIIYLLFNIKAYKAIYFLPLLGFITLFLGKYSFLLGSEETILLDFNFLGCGLPYVALGFCIHRYESVLLKYSWLDLTAVILIFNWIEMALLGSLADQYWGRFFFTMPLTGAFLCLAISRKEYGAESIFATIGKKYSGNIYYFHFLIIYIFRVVIDKVLPFTSDFYQNVGFILVFFASLIVAQGIVWIQDRFQWDILR
ncbi:hypothetical protein HQ48_00790 [Porphyromonas sp. COT-290 OH3588]|nr:hypothetical protein HQ48_00790 [Porphyromonas sp. COT-290 OH3588]